MDVQQYRPPLRRSRSFWYESTDLAILQFKVLDSPDRPDRGTTRDVGCFPDIWVPGDGVWGNAMCNVFIVDGDVFRINEREDVWVDSGGEV